MNSVENVDFVYYEIMKVSKRVIFSIQLVNGQLTQDTRIHNSTDPNS